MTNSANVTQPLELIYLDANATTPVLPQAAAAALSTMETIFGNPSSSHITGLQAKQLMENTRHKAKHIIGAGNGDVIFTSGATEGIQTAILSALVHARKTLDSNKTYTLLYGATEHKAVPESLKHWKELLGINAELKEIPVNEIGQLDTDFIAREVPNAIMICTMAVNNETGVYQDLAHLDQVIRTNNHQVFWMVDCVQALGKTALKLASTSIDYAPFSGHKLYAPKGIGFVYVKENAPFTAFIAGGGQEGGMRSGTENLPGMAALSVIFDMLSNPNDDGFKSVTVLEGFRQQLVAALTQAFPSIVFNHSFENSVPTTLNFAIPGFSSKEMMDLFDAANMRVSSGSACSSKVTSSFVLDAMGLPAWRSESAIRMSFGPAMTQQQVDQTCDRITFCANALIQSCLVTTNTDDSANKNELSGLMQFKEGGSCCWLYVDGSSKNAVIIDPLAEISQRLQTIVACQALTLTAIIDTHGHADHLSCRPSLAEKLSINQPTDALGWPTDSSDVTINGQQYSTLNIGDKYLVKVETPGHTDDSISLLLCDSLATNSTGELNVRYAFCGDTILIGSLGRTNFSTSSAPAMYSSLQLLNKLIGKQTLICPSHDYHNEFATNIAAEMATQCMLKQIIDNTMTSDEFVIKKAALDSHIIDQSGSEIICGAFIKDNHLLAIEQYNSDSLATAMAQLATINLIDIRESHEYALHRDNRFSSNVPLTRLVDFIGDNELNKQDKIVLVCRSGSRSHLAAQTLARLGFDKVGHLTGGYALNQ
ncbi:MAG: aminotransferase class V-fold PLP-dependent enzyme [Psychrobium sp.]|nr:aminotransferase class V-fold PLP-dependent enzyme [Psychrobium sp.]